MTPATATTALTTSPATLSFEEFLNWVSGDDVEYDLVEGVPVPYVDPNAKHETLSHQLYKLLDRHCEDRNLPYVPMQHKRVLFPKATPEGKDTARIADLVVFDRQEWKRLQESSGPALAYVPPPMVVEVASTNWRTDYLNKLGEYETLGIPEYWIVDYAALGATRYIGKPKQPTLSIYRLDAEGEYQVSQFRGDEAIASPTFPDLGVTANEIFKLADR